MNLNGSKQRFLAAALSGFLVALGFPGEGFPWISAGYLMPFAYLPLFLAISSLPKPTSGSTGYAFGERILTPWKRFRSAFLLAWTSGTVTVAIAFFWCTYPAILFGGIPPAAAYPSFALYALAAGTFFPAMLLPFLLQAGHEARRNAQLLPILPLAFLSTALEIWLPRFFQWSLGSLMHWSLSISQSASIAGFSGVTFLILLSNGMLARAFTERASRPIHSVARIVGVGTLWLTVSLFGHWRMGKIHAELAQSGETSHVGLVQPNFTFEELSSNPNRSPLAQTQSLTTLLTATEQLIQSSNPPLDLLVWPESVAPNLFGVSEDQINRTKDIAAQSGTTILTQAVEFDENTVTESEYRNTTLYSTSFLLRPDRSRSPSYRKWIPIPFGETVPLENWFPSWGEFIRHNVGNTSKVGRGTSFEALPYSPSHAVAPLICFDAIDTELPRLQAKYGKANLFANQSNFAWMGHSSAGYQFKELVRFRAIENGRSALLAANTGPSVIFDPVGQEITETTPLMAPASLSAQVPIWHGTTLFQIWGDWPLQILGGLSAVFLLGRMSNISRRKNHHPMLN